MQLAVLQRTNSLLIQNGNEQTSSYGRLKASDQKAIKDLKQLVKNIQEEITKATAEASEARKCADKERTL